MSGWRAPSLLAAMALASPAAGQDAAPAPAAPAGPGEYKPSVEQVTVQKGDTLWDLSARLAGSPWFWARVWSYNPEIANPHWIYPGDVVRFYPSEVPLPRMAEPIASRREMPTEEPEAQPEVQPAPEPTPAKRGVVESVEPMRPAARRRARPVAAYFLTQRELAESGTLTNAVDDKILLSQFDEVFITFPSSKRPSPGERYMVYRTVREVEHPVTHQPFGFLTEVTGFASIRASEEDVSRATLGETLVEVERGQLVTPLAQLPATDIPPTQAKVPLNGVVVAVSPGSTRYAGEDQLVFVDIGSGSGLEVGNRLAVFVQGDPYVPMQKSPLTRVGTLVVVDVRQGASTCVVAEARREIEAGQPVKTLMH